MDSAVKQNTSALSPLLITAVVAVPILVWSAAVAVSGIFASRFGPLTAASIELLVSGVCLSLFAVIRGNFAAMFQQSWWYYLFCGIYWVANLSFFWLAIGSVTRPAELLVVGLFNYLWPSLTLVCAVLMLKRVWRWPLVVGLSASLIGAGVAKVAVSGLPLAEVLSVLRDEPNLVAYVFAIGAALSWALYSNFSRIYASTALPGAVPLFMLVASALLGVSGRIVAEPIQAEWRHYIWIVLYGSLSGVAFLLWDIGMRAGKVVLISAMSMCIPLFSTLITAYTTATPITLTVFTAAGLTVLGSYLSRRSVDE